MVVSNNISLLLPTILLTMACVLDDLSVGMESDSKEDDASDNLDSLLN